MMQRGKIYTLSEMKSVWHQFYTNPDFYSLVWSEDIGKTWNAIPSMDTGKWPLFSIINGQRVDWLFKLDDAYLKIIVKKNCIIADGQETPTEKYLEYSAINDKLSYLNLRYNSNISNISHIIIENKSGRHIYITDKIGRIITLASKQSVEFTDCLTIKTN